MNISDSSVHEKEREVKIRVLHDVSIGQRDDLSLLCSIVEYLKSHRSMGLDHNDTKRLTEKLNALKSRQTHRYEVIDRIINENRKDIKNGETDSRMIVEYGKDIRKLESGLRTLILFTGDVIEMLKLDSTVEDRVDDRIYYFDKRSSALEIELSTLQRKMATI